MIRLVNDHGHWIAVIGPDAQVGLVGVAATPIQALINLAVKCARHRWPFDDSWTPGKTTLHDA